MRVLAIDHGSKRIGIAVSDELKSIAQPLIFLPAAPFTEFLGRLKEIIGEKEVELILVGMPRNMDGGDGLARRRVREFVALRRERTVVPRQTWDGRLPGVQANRP